MGGLSLEIQSLELDDAVRRLDKLGGALADKTPLMARLAAYLASSTRERFETQTGPDGQRWKPSIRAQLTGGATLLDRGILRDRIAQDHGPDFAAAGTNDIRARLLHFGGTIQAKGKALAFRLPGGLGLRLVKSVTIPGRPFFGASAEDRQGIGDIVSDYLLEAGA